LQEETGLSQRRIADMLGVSSCRISQAKRMRREVEGNPRWEALRKDNVSAEVAYELLNYTPNEVPKLMKDFKQSSDPQKTRRSQGPPLHFLRRLRAVTTLREAYFGGQVTLPQVQMLLSAFPVTRTSEISALASWVARAKPSQETLTGLLEQVQRGMPLELLIPGESPSLSAPEPISMLLGTLAQNHSGSIRGARVALRLADSEAERSELIVVLTCKGRPEADAIIGLAKTAEALQQPDRERSGQT